MGETLLSGSALAAFLAGTAPCSERVVFPDYGISMMLPPYEDVAVDLPASEPGEHEFTCQMEMLRGRIVIDRTAVAP